MKLIRPISFSLLIVTLFFILGCGSAVQVAGLAMSGVKATDRIQSYGEEVTPLGNNQYQVVYTGASEATSEWAKSANKVCAGYSIVSHSATPDTTHKGRTKVIGVIRCPESTARKDLKSVEIGDETITNDQSKITEELQKRGVKTLVFGPKYDDFRYNQKYYLITYNVELNEKPFYITMAYDVNNTGTPDFTGKYLLIKDEDKYKGIGLSNKSAISQAFKKRGLELDNVNVVSPSSDNLPLQPVVQQESQPQSKRLWDPGKKKYYRYDQSGNRVYE